ncbi:hypothetical protein [Streptomyces avicenniae]|uniref:hypothetical protein n=1 Tax=Streptomyces avicenniae TaxID=500153 RepID=UPI00069B37A2|nr:hypothetical protein [Streptomyces avicenniae]
MDRNPKRRAARAMAWAAVPVLLAAGCSSDASEPDDDAGAETSAEAAPTPEPVRFTTLPESCATVRESTVEEFVPEADPVAGQTLTSSDVTSSATCLWNGLDGYQYRSLTVALRRYDSDLAIGSGDERAAGYAEQVVEEITGDDANQDVDAGPLDETGEEATSLAWTVTKTDDDQEQDYRQHRVVARLGNVVVTVDYNGAGLEGDDMPGADGIASGAIAVAREAVAALDASGDGTGAEAEGGDDTSGGDEPPGNEQDAPAEDGGGDNG